MLLPFVIFSQKDKKPDTNEICLPYYVAKKISLDLNKLDSLMEVSKLHEKEIKLLNKKVVLLDSIIITYEQKEKNYKEQIEKEQEKFKIVENQNNELRNEIKKTKRRNTIKDIIGGAIILGLTYIIAIK